MQDPKVLDLARGNIHNHKVYIYKVDVLIRCIISLTKILEITVLESDSILFFFCHILMITPNYDYVTVVFFYNYHKITSIATV